MDSIMILFIVEASIVIGGGICVLIIMCCYYGKVTKSDRELEMELLLPK